MTVQECENAGIAVDATVLDAIGLRDIRDEMAMLQQMAKNEQGDEFAVQQLNESIDEQLSEAQHPRPEVPSDFRPASGGSRAASTASSQQQCHTANSIEDEPLEEELHVAEDQNLSDASGQLKQEAGLSDEQLPSHARPTVSSLAAARGAVAQKPKKKGKKATFTQQMKFEKS